MIIEQALRLAFKANNNKVEYEALVVGLLLARELGARSLMVKSDLLLVTGQVTGEYQAKDPQMASYLRYVTLLRETFPTFKLVHVPREQNAQADLLAKLAAHAREVDKVSYSGDPKVTQNHCRWSNRGQSCGDLGGRLSKKKKASIIDTRNVEGAQDKCLWLVGRRIVGRLASRRSGDMDDTIPTLPC
ncbi:uncharacterized protein [Phaseolus vulgaris]|uniref:uncharacterized protein n=1 Tax=Phaseolus vulgaris TaxID=3885 RepID=UPI0035C9FC93